MRQHLQDRHSDMEKNIGKDIVETRNALGQDIIDPQNAIGHALILSLKMSTGNLLSILKT